MPLYHFSEEPDIRVFQPRVGLIATESYVWAIDEWHAPMYYFPRDCPRACFWPGPTTSDEDRERWFGGVLIRRRQPHWLREGLAGRWRTVAAAERRTRHDCQYKNE